MVKPSYGLGDTRTTRMQEDSYSRAAADMKMPMQREAQVSARQLIDATEAALAASRTPISKAINSRSLHRLGV